MKFGIVTFPGSNCDYDAYYAVAGVLGAEAVYLWHKNQDLQGADVIVLPGGFSYGDYLRAGAIARFSPVMNEVIAHAKRGGPVLAICNGFQIACEAGLLPGALLRNSSLKFISTWARLRVESSATQFTSGYNRNQLLRIPIAHGEGRFTAGSDVLSQIEDNDQVVFRYASRNGETTDVSNPNGSMNNIAGIVNGNRNVLGMMPHPERAMESALGSTDGKALFESLLAATAA